jgi:hypothetical protein
VTNFIIYAIFLKNISHALPLQVWKSAFLYIKKIKKINKSSKNKWEVIPSGGARVFSMKGQIINKYYII